MFWIQVSDSQLLAAEQECVDWLYTCFLQLKSRGITSFNPLYRWNIIWGWLRGRCDLAVAKGNIQLLRWFSTILFNHLNTFWFCRIQCLSMLQCSVWSKLYNNGEQWHRTACWNIRSHWHSNEGGPMVTHWHTCLLDTFKPFLPIVCWTDNTFRDSFSCIIRSSVWVNVNGKAGLVVRRGDMSNREEIDCEILWFPPLSIWCPPDPQNYGIVCCKVQILAAAVTLLFSHELDCLKFECGVFQLQINVGDTGDWQEEMKEVFVESNGFSN